LIAETVTAVRQQIEPTTRIVVIADNCTDETADFARSAGAIVIERKDRSRRGKGFALASARNFLSAQPPDAVFVLDADCRIVKGNLQASADYAVSLREPVQSVNLLSASVDVSSLVLVSNFAMLIKNLVRARGLYRLGGGITLFGTGMMLPWRVFLQLNLATSEAVEDLGMALSLALDGTKVHFDEHLLVTSPAAALADSLDQRRRWEHGFLAHAVRAALPLLLRGTIRRSRHLIALGAHMLVPPLALLFILGAAALVPALAAALHGNPAPAAVLLCAFALATVALGAAWTLDGRTTLPWQALLRAPFYILWKVPFYVGFISARRREWNRSRRPNEKN
jgi:cellulose synthase/poly-beta-1,6-N-acetylglucosamine synthase-like glycosyltransferase